MLFLLDSKQSLAYLYYSLWCLDSNRDSIPVVCIPSPSSRREGSGDYWFLRYFICFVWIECVLLVPAIYILTFTLTLNMVLENREDVIRVFDEFRAGIDDRNDKRERIIKVPFNH